MTVWSQKKLEFCKWGQQKLVHWYQNFLLESGRVLSPSLRVCAVRRRWLAGAHGSAEASEGRRGSTAEAGVQRARRWPEALRLRKRLYLRKRRKKAMALIVALLLAGRRYERPSLGEMLRLLPDLLRLLKRLAGDKSLPRGVRVRLWLLLAYLAAPLDLVPDFIPVIGYADAAIIGALALRSVARRAGTQALHRHWPGTPGGLVAVLRAAGTTWETPAP